MVKVRTGMKVQIDPKEFEGKFHAGKQFIVAGRSNIVCGTECVPLNNLDGSRFSANYDLSMLQIIDTNCEV